MTHSMAIEDLPLLVPHRAATQSPHRKVSRRALPLARLRWLESAPYWNEGRAMWPRGDGFFRPTTADFNFAERALREAEKQHRHLGEGLAQQWRQVRRNTIIDAASWLIGCRRALGTARRLAAQDAPDLALLGAASRARNPAALERLANLLEAEALCLQMAPLSPCRALSEAAVENGDAVRRALHHLIARQSGDAWHCGQVVAAALWGEIDRRDAVSGRTHTAPAFVDADLKSAYQSGRVGKYKCRQALGNLPFEMALKYFGVDAGSIAALLPLLQAERMPLATRDVVKEALWRGCSAEQVLEMVRASDDFSPLLRRLATARHELESDESSRGQQARDGVVQALRALIGSGAGAPSLKSAACWMEQMLEMQAPRSVLWREIAFVIGNGARLAQGCGAATTALWFELLEQSFASVWDIETRPVMPTSQRRTRWRERWQREHRCWVQWMQARRTRSLAPLETLLRRGHDAPFMAMRCGRLSDLANRPAMDARRCELWQLGMQWSLEMQHEGEMWRVGEVCEFLLRFDDASTARRQLKPLVGMLQHIPAPHRLETFSDCIDVIEENAHHPVRCAIAECIQTLLPVIQLMAARNVDWAAVSAYHPLRGALHVWRWSAETADRESRRAWLVQRWCDWKAEKPQRVQDWQMAPIIALASVLSRGDEAMFRRLVQIGLLRRMEIDESGLWDGLGYLVSRPLLSAALAQLFARQPQRCFELVRQMGALTTDEISEMDTLEAVTKAENDPTYASRDAWRALDELCGDDGAMEVDIALWRWAQRHSGQPDTLPRGWVEVLEWPQRWGREIAHIAHLAALDPRPHLLERLNNLRARLADEQGVLRSMRAEIGERLRSQVPPAVVSAAEAIVRRATMQRLQRIVGEAPLLKTMPEGEFQDDVLNATLLIADIDSNRRLLRRLLRAELGIQTDGSDEVDWRLRHPENARFVASLRARGVDVDKWLSERRESFDLNGSQATLWLETRPLRVLQMGNFFGTCLSRGDINAFSTVANACELNKRVLYAADAQGRIIGRQLIGLNAEGELIGFHIYASLQDTTANARLRALFTDYARAFARDCHLALGNSGTVPRLFAQSWYDDGVVQWDEASPTEAQDASRTKAVLQLAGAASQIAVSTPPASKYLKPKYFRPSALHSHGACGAAAPS